MNDSGTQMLSHQFRSRVGALLLIVVLGLIGTAPRSRALDPKRWSPVVPRTWDDELMRTLEVPLPDPAISAKHVSANYYYQIPVRPVYRTYPVYRPGREPAGYLEWLRKREPETLFDSTRLRTKEQWRRAGERVFDAPIDFESEGSALFKLLRDPAWYEVKGVSVTRDGMLPNFTYVVREKGKVEVGVLACASCHTRVTPDGRAFKGAQGNFPDDRMFGFEMRFENRRSDDKADHLRRMRSFMRRSYGAPWVSDDPNAQLQTMSVDELAAIMEAIPPGVCARQGSSPFYPPRIPDLFGVKDRKYLDASGHFRNRDTGDLMRYAALNQGMDELSRYGTWRPTEPLPEPAKLGRYSDEQLYALALYLESLEPPPSPYPFNRLAAQGKRVFQEERCARCHTPPLYTNNKLIPADEFTVPKEHREQFHVASTHLGTDSSLTLRSRRGSGYYKVPGLRGLWLRGPFEHNGSVATLEDWFDARRVQEDYQPTGFRRFGLAPQAVKGHDFGLDLSAEDKRALIAFLMTL